MATTMLQKTVQGNQRRPIIVYGGTDSRRGCDTRNVGHGAMLSKQCVLYTHAVPYLGVGVKQAVSLVGEDLCEACKQSNETIGSDDVT